MSKVDIITKRLDRCNIMLELLKEWIAEEEDFGGSNRGWIKLMADTKALIKELEDE